MSEKIMPCEWLQDEFCVNDKCPYCADYCPLTENPEVCKYGSERTGRWIFDEIHSGKNRVRVVCSNCTHYQTLRKGLYESQGVNWIYCPNCGAHMTAETRVSHGRAKRQDMRG